MAVITGSFNSLVSGTISGVFQNTAGGVLSGVIGTPGPQGSQGEPGQGVPVGGSAGQALVKIDGTNYNTEWSSLPAFLTKAGNLSGLTDLSVARQNLTLGSSDTPVFGGLDAVSGANVAHLSPTALSLTQSGHGQFTIQPSQGIVFPDASVQTTAWNDAPSDGDQYARQDGAWSVVTTTPDFITSVTAPLAVTTGNLTVDLSTYAPLASPVFTGDARAVTAALHDNDTSIATTAFVQQELLSGTANARNLEVYVRNQTGSTIPIGSIVYINGATGNRPTITLAQANNDTNSAQTIGFTKTAIADNGFGFVIVRGELENLNTNSLTEGVQLYLSPTTAGAYTITKPSAPQHLVYVGIVIRAHPTQGVILVSVQNGYELNELHDVALASEANLDLLTYESSTDLWKNKSFATLGLAKLASPAFTGNVTINSSTGAALFIEQTGTGNILTLHDQATDTNFVAIDQNGKINTVVADATTAGLNVPHTTVVPTTPVNGDIWTTTGGLFVRINSGTQQFAALSTNNTFSNASSTYGNSTAAGTLNFGTGAVISGATRVINIGTASAAGSTNNVNIGGGSGTTNVTLGGSIALSGPITSGVNNISLGTGTAASIYAFGTGATATGLTKAVTIGTGGLAGSTTNITVGSTTGTSTTTLQGTTNGITQTVGDNSTKLATTAFVTAAVPAFATNDQALTSTSTTTALSPFNSRFSHLAPFVFAPVTSSMTSVTSGGGSSTMNAYGGSIGSSGSLAGYSLRHATPYIRGVTTTGGIQWQKPQMFAVRLVPFFAFQTASIFRMTLGSNTATLNVLANRGIGIRFGASATNVLSALVLDVHNGTTLTSVTSSFTPVLAQGFDLMVYSDGAGNVTLYANDVQVATTSAGPISAAVANYNILQLGIENTTTLTTGSNVAFGSLKTFIS